MKLFKNISRTKEFHQSMNLSKKQALCLLTIIIRSMDQGQTLPHGKRNELLKAFGTFKETVLWKWENETLPDQPKNVQILKWMPQREILCHPNVRVFVR